MRALHPGMLIARAPYVTVSPQIVVFNEQLYGLGCSIVPCHETDATLPGMRSIWPVADKVEAMECHCDLFVNEGELRKPFWQMRSQS